MRTLAAQNIIRTGRRRLEFIDLQRLQTAIEKFAVQAAPESLGD